MIRVFVVSPLPAVRAGLRALLGLADDLQVVGEAARLELDSEATFEAASEVVVVDAGSDLDLVEALAAGRIEQGPGLVILGPVPEPERLAAALARRAWAYLGREAGPEPLVAAVRAVASGLTALDPNLGSDLFARPGTLARSPGSDEDLTAREREVLQLVALGLPNKTIAQRLSISEHTVKFHVAAILARLGAGSRTEAVHLGARRGLVVL